MVNCARRALFWLKTPNVAKIQQNTPIRIKDLDVVKIQQKKLYFGIDTAFKMRIIVDVVSNSAYY